MPSRRSQGRGRRTSSERRGRRTHASPARRARPSYKKSYGQHHLRSGELCRPLLEYLAPETGQRVLEIGPGGGVLTRELVAAGADVWALELDLEWAFHLRSAGRSWPASGSSAEGSESAGHLRILGCDALDFPWSRLIESKAGTTPGGTLLTGNLPFNVGTRLIDETLTVAASAPESMPRLGYMVQKEVADRLLARPGDSAYGALSVLVAAQARARLLGDLAPGAFRPPPKVSAAFVGLDPRRSPVSAESWPELRRMVFLAFAKRRKTLVNSLGSEWGRKRAEAVVAEAGLEPKIRAEALGLDEMLTLFDAHRRASEE